ncbi:MAG: DUF2182 domain-containing protein [Kiloniellaceae bacterium]
MIESVLKRDRVVVLAGLAGVTALAWAYLLVMAAGMAELSGATGGAMLAVKPWTAVDFLLMFLMWAVMMVGMMVPSASPMILLFALVSRRQREQGAAFAPTGAFVAGYVVVWTGFSLAASALQWALNQAALLSSMMATISPTFGGLLLIAAGLYQWTPLKHACLKHCRSPLQFITTHWRKGTRGAFRMGLEHGVFCVGCCWVLMGLLFVGGVMNLLWIAAIAGFVLLEKTLPIGGRASGLLLTLGGLFAILQA